MTLDQTLQLIQVAYPQVYLACHTRHQRKRSTEHRLSARDSAILAHLDCVALTVPSLLATHLHIGRSTVSEALKRLAALGFVEKIQRAAVESRRGGIGVRLTEKGLAAIRETSVFEEGRLREVLLPMSPNELRAIARGISTLAAACHRLSEATSHDS